ncbi:MAG: hypothetical protein AAGK14_08595 [Verrucomicrobiota bacterium]
MSPARKASRFVFHLLPNAHLDPVWLWDWAEGMNEGIVTVRTMLDLMDEYPELTFIRGESSIYAFIERHDPTTFARLRRMIKTGRWDVVGGTYNQPDTNLPSTELLCRQFEVGQAYFKSRFGLVPKVMWQADSFGHSPGLPNIMRAYGVKYFMFTRPMRDAFTMHDPLFRWATDFGDTVLCYRPYHQAYCSERYNLPLMLDENLEKATRTKHLRHVGIPMGLGNHGGGTTRRLIRDAYEWAEKHPEVEVKFSTFHRFFALMEKEEKARAYRMPVIRGDLGFTLRGCYASVAKFKIPYRRAEALVPEAEATQAIIGTQLKLKPEPLDEAWDGVLFNSFHDILPGTSIERAFDEQIPWVGLSIHQAHRTRLAALNRLSQEVDTRVPPPPGPDRAADVPLLVWNPLSRPFKGWLELETPLDYRMFFNLPKPERRFPLVLFGPGGEKPAFQEIPVESEGMLGCIWRIRLAFQTELPPLGWKVFRLGFKILDPIRPAPVYNRTACVARPGARPSIRSRDWEVNVTASGRVKILHKGQPFFGRDGTMSLQVFEDQGGSWGGSIEVESNLGRAEKAKRKALEHWKIVRVEILQEGPEQAVLWTRWEGANSWTELTYKLRRNSPQIHVAARTLWNERAKRLRLVFPADGDLEMQVPGSRVRRTGSGSLPCGRWLKRGGFAFVSDALSSVDALPGEVRVTVCRASRYAGSKELPGDAMPWLPAVDCGELKYNFILTTSKANLEHVAEELLHPPTAVYVPPHDGPRGQAGSLAEITPHHVRLLAARPDGSGKLAVRVQNLSEKAATATLTLGGRRRGLGMLKPYQIKTCVVPASPGKA